MFQCVNVLWYHDGAFNATSGVHFSIYGVDPPKSMKLPMDSSSVTQSLFSLL